jgi:hypothetical protein
MIEFMDGKRGWFVVAALLLIQAGLFVLSLVAFFEMSFLCTYSASLRFGLLHLVFLGLFVLGVGSLSVVGLRLPYIVLLTLALLMLSVQVALVWKGVLVCDGP